MCQQEHTPIRQVQRKNGKIAFKCNCGHFHPYKRMLPNEMDASTCIPKDEIDESSSETVYPKPQPALNLQSLKEEPRSGNWGGTKY